MTLFLKIFLWFWGAMACLGLALLLLQITTQDDLVLPPRRGLMSDALGGYGRLAVRIYKKDGEAGLFKYLRTVKVRSQVTAFLLTPDGRQLGPGRAPTEMRDLALTAQKLAEDGSEDPQFSLSSLNVAAAQPVHDTDGIYVLSGFMRRGLITATRSEPSVRLLRISVVLLTTGLVCFALARYLSKPVSRVRQAARRIARGDLTARASNTPSRGKDELSGLTRDFDAMAERLEALVTAQTRLLGDVSHELRSPLARLNLALELARRGEGTKKAAALDRIERESLRLEELIKELLTLSRLESGLRLDEGAPPVDLAQLCKDIAGDANFEAAQQEVQVVLESGVDLAPVRGDAELLHRAIENVARNAVRHSPPGGKVEMKLDRDNEHWTLAIQDQGTGVPEADLASIFMPFYRVESARERSINESGTGLGLAIADRATRAHGGRIEAHNAAEGGLVVQISLPALPTKSAGIGPVMQ